MLNKIKLQKNKIYQLENELVKIKYKNEIEKDSNKIHVVNKNLHEIEIEILEDYTGVFEMICNIKIGDQIRQTRIRFRKIDVFNLISIALMMDMKPMIVFSLVIYIN